MVERAAEKVISTDLCGRLTPIAGIRITHRTLPVAFGCALYAELRKTQKSLDLPLLAFCGPPPAQMKAAVCHGPRLCPVLAAAGALTAAHLLPDLR